MIIGRMKAIELLVVDAERGIRNIIAFMLKKK